MAFDYETYVYLNIWWLGKYDMQSEAHVMVFVMPSNASLFASIHSTTSGGMRRTCYQAEIPA